MMLLLIFLLYAILLSIGLGLAGYRSAPAAPQPEPGEPPTRILVIGATGGTGTSMNFFDATLVEQDGGLVVDGGAFRLPPGNVGRHQAGDEDNEVDLPQQRLHHSEGPGHLSCRGDVAEAKGREGHEAVVEERRLPGVDDLWWDESVFVGIGKP